MKRLNNDGIREQHGCGLLLDRYNLVKADDQVRDPSENVTGEAKMALGNVQTPMKQDLFLKGCTIVLDQIVVLGNAFEQGMEILISPRGCNRESSSV
jgi:hypothetical protein